MIPGGFKGGVSPLVKEGQGQGQGEGQGEGDCDCEGEGCGLGEGSEFERREDCLVKVKG